MVKRERRGPERSRQGTGRKLKALETNAQRYRLGAVVSATALLLTAFFSCIYFELYGESEFCRQKYNLPPLSFYAERFDCFFAAGDLAAKVMHILVLVTVPLFLSSLTTLWVDWPRRGSGPSGQHLAPAEPNVCARIDVVSQAQLWFWIMTAAVGIALVGGLMLYAVALWRVSLDGVVGSALMYALHLYPAGILVFCGVETAAWMCGAILTRSR